MKKIELLLTLLALSIMSISCKSPYQNYTPLSSYDELVYPYPTKKVSLSNAIEIAYVDQGKGSETLIFIHGLGSYLPAWKKNIDALQNQYRCIAIDLPGYGKSSKGDYEGSMEFFAEIVKEFAEAIQVENYLLVGHSMGGQIAMTHALRYPGKAKALILAAPAGFETFDEGQKQWFREVVTPKGTALTPAQAIISNYRSNFNKMPKDADFMIRDRLAMRTAKGFDGYCYIISQSIKGMVNQPVFDFLPQIKIPVLILYGSYDNLIPNRFLNPGKTEKIAQQGHEKLPNSYLVMVPKSGHFVQWEGFEVFNTSISQFIENQYKLK